MEYVIQSGEIANACGGAKDPVAVKANGRQVSASSHNHSVASGSFTQPLMPQPFAQDDVLKGAATFTVVVFEKHRLSNWVAYTSMKSHPERGTCECLWGAKDPVAEKPNALQVPASSHNHSAVSGSFTLPLMPQPFALRRSPLDRMTFTHTQTGHTKTVSDV